jgi:hypothetical protein
LTALAAAQPTPDPQVVEDEKLVRPVLPADAQIDAQTLTDFFRKLTLSDADQKRIQALIARLNAESFKEREQVTKQLIAEGLPALPLLQQPPAGASLEQIRRLERCAKAIERPGWTDALAAAARLLAHHAPKDAAATLLAYLPFAPGDVPEDILVALDQLTAKASAVDPAILAALESPRAGQRAAAAALVGARGTVEQRKVVVRLLDDASPLVRFHAAQGLLAGRDKTAIPVLVSLLKNGPAHLAENAEAILLEVAAATAPKVDWHNTKEDREKSHDAWLAWWHQHKDKLEIAATDSGLWLANSERLAKDVASKCFHSLGGVDLVTLRKVAAVPFRWGDGRTVNSYDELQQVFNGDKSSPEFLKQFTPKQVTTPKEFVKIARFEYKEYLNNLHGGKFYVVSWTFPGGGAMELGLVVRVRGATARAIGVVASN